MGWVLRLIDTDASSPASCIDVMEIGLTGDIAGVEDLGPTLSKGQAAFGARAAGGRCQAGPMSRGGSAELFFLSRSMPHKGLAVPSDCDCVRCGHAAAPAVLLHWLWSC